MVRKVKLQKYPEDFWVIRGEAQTGKSTLVMEMMREYGFSLLWNTDGRIQEYAAAVGPDNFVVPISPAFEVREIADELRRDQKEGNLKTLGFAVMDNLTHLYQETVRRTLQDKIEGGKSSYVDKANIMKITMEALTRLNVPYVVVWHLYEAGDQRGNKSMRDSLSPTEVDRIKMFINGVVETVKQGDKFGVRLVYCRQRPGLKPFILWDEPGNMFKGMPARIRAALYDQEQAAKVEETVSEPDPQEPSSWDEFGFNNPFPNPDIAIQLGTEYFKEVNGVKHYAFGDPYEIPVKKDGTPGTNGALVYARNAYEKVKGGDYPKDLFEGKPGSAGEMAVRWKATIDHKIDEAIHAPTEELEPEVHF